MGSTANNLPSHTSTPSSSSKPFTGTVHSHQNPSPPTTATLTRSELLRLRSSRAKQQIRFLKDCHWALLEDLRLRLRHYYWKYGASPVDEDQELGFGNGTAENGGCRRRERKEVVVRVCAFPGCKAKPMELTNYCHQHILSDPKQTLYKPCSYVIKSGATGPVLCWKPVLRSAVPALCPIHFQKAQKHISQAFKKAGLNMPSSNRPAPKFHVIIAEYVRQIQSKRKEARSALENNKNKGKNIG